MPDNLIFFPTSDTLRAMAAVRAARRAETIAASREFDDDAVRLVLERVEHELEEASVAAGLCAPEKRGTYETPQTQNGVKKAA